MASQLDIYNLAIGRVGSDKTVAALNENSKEARLCNRNYAQCRDEVMESAAFPFAVKVKALASVTPNLQLDGWAYQFAKPDDCLRILEVGPLSEAGASIGYWGGCCGGPWDAYKREGMFAYRLMLADDGNSSVILANNQQSYITYVAKVTNAAVFSPMMVSTIADRLSMELALPLTASSNWLQVAMTRYNNSFNINANIQYDQQDNGPDPMPASILARN